LGRNWYRSKKKAFTRYAKKHSENSGQSITRELERIKKYCTVVRVLAHSQLSKTGLQQKKAHLIEIQVNGGSVAEKVDWCKDNFEKPLSVGSVFEKDECIDICGVSKGHGVEGVIKRWGVTSECLLLTDRTEVPCPKAPASRKFVTHPNSFDLHFIFATYAQQPPPSCYFVSSLFWTF
jgi:hypothetical protein